MTLASEMSRKPLFWQAIKSAFSISRQLLIYVVSGQQEGIDLSEFIGKMTSNFLFESLCTRLPKLILKRNPRPQKLE